MAEDHKKPGMGARRPVNRPARSAGDAARQAAMKRRVRPSVRAEARKAAVSQRPLPTPPRRPAVSRRPAAATAAPELTAQLNSIHDKFERLSAQAQMEDVFSAVGDIDDKLTKLPFDLEALRDRGYVHSGQLEDKLEALDDQWDDLRPRVEKALNEQVQRLDTDLDQAERQMTRLNNANAAVAKSVDTAVDALGSRVTAARRAVEGLYDGIKAELYKIEYALGQVQKMLDLMAGSSEISLQEAEGPLLAVAAKWQQDGEDGPEGYLFLTDQRLLFEQREEVVTKKRFGLFKAESEMVQKLQIATQVHEIEQISHKEEGGFLGMGKADILELVFAATAPLSRARWHLKGQDSADWAAMINRIQSGEIDGDRSDEYVDELEAAGITSASFPEQCPNCYAAVPPQPRGVTVYECEFCGATVMPTISK